MFLLNWANHTIKGCYSMGFFDFLKVNEFKTEIESLKKQLQKKEEDFQRLSLEKAELDKLSLTIDQLDYLNLKEEISLLHSNKDTLLRELEQLKADKASAENQHKFDVQALSKQTELLVEEKNKATDELEKINKSISTAQKKLTRIKVVYKSAQSTLEHYFKNFANKDFVSLSSLNLKELDELAPTVTVKLHCMDVKDLRKAFNDNSKIIQATLESYAARYTTKANIAIYQLMVIALQAELQNILYNIKYGSLNEAITAVKTTTQKYIQIAADGNQNIAGTMLKFIGDIEYLFIESVKIEYEYQIRKEQIKQEQAALREQMRQEAEERKALELEKQQIEKEEIKYKNEIDNLTTQLTISEDDEKSAQLKARIAELELQLTQIESKKEEIIALQNGKAGNVYIISNVGSFGEEVFKIGMTRRLDPQERVNELGSASVPFRFDVHSFIFSDDAVALEQKLHTMLHEKRVNKVNLRKEFFNISLKELEDLVLEIEPTAEFNSTMLAEEYRQSLSLVQEELCS